MNNENLTYTIGVIGFDRSERRALRRAVGLAETRQPSFTPFDASRGGCPHLIMVDADRPSAMRAWDKFRRANALRASFSPIFIGRNPGEVPFPDPYVLQRPILTTRLFSVLDQAAAEVHGFRPPASVEDGIVALTQQEIDGTLETTTVLPTSAAVPPAESEDSARLQRATPIHSLVVDDSLPVRVQMRSVLTPIAARVDFADSGERALELVRLQAYSIIFLDNTLPDADAYDLCGQIKKQSLQSEASVVMLTADSSAVERVMGLLAGFDNFLVKPVQTGAFNDLLAELVRPAAAI
jgi:twitching motility two-component system response regulator PilG